MTHKFVPKTLIQKSIFTFIILVIYLMGREIPLFGIDHAAYSHMDAEVGDLLSQTIGGDQFKTSLFALGITPYMFSMMFVQIAVACRSADSKRRTSPKRISEISLIVTLVWAIIQTYFQVQSTYYLAQGSELVLVKFISGIQMITGAFVILWLATRNAKYGIGGQTALISINLLSSIVSIAKKAEFKDFKIVLLISIIAGIIAVILENSEFRIPMQRISIHNIYSDKNYIAIKLNPVGMMPVMFATAAFMIPMYVSMALFAIKPDNETFGFLVENMSMDKAFGTKVYIVILYLITILFAFVFIGPKNTAETLAKSGDSITGLRAGRKTRWYLSKCVIVISLFSATFIALAIGIPMYLQTLGIVKKEIMSFPTVIMAMAGLSCNLYREYIAVRDYDAYIPFL